MEASDDPTINLDVTCHQVITVTHIPMSFMTMMLEDSTLLTTPLEKATQDLAMENIKDVVLLWLTRYNGSLHYQQVDYPSNTSHPCLSPSRMSFESLLNTVCRIVFTGLYSQEEDSFQVTYEMNPPPPTTSPSSPLKENADQYFLCLAPMVSELFKNSMPITISKTTTLNFPWNGIF